MTDENDRRSYDPEPAFVALVQKREPMTVRDVDLDGFADGVLAQRQGRGFHENPDGMAPTLRRLSWTLGWNERALQHRDAGPRAGDVPVGPAIGTQACPAGASRTFPGSAPDAFPGTGAAPFSREGDDAPWMTRTGAVTTEDVVIAVTRAARGALLAARHNLALLPDMAAFRKWLDAEIATTSIATTPGNHPPGNHPPGQSRSEPTWR